MENKGKWPPGKHPNSLAALRPQKAGEPSHNPSGRPKKDLAAGIAEWLFEHQPEAIKLGMLKTLKKGNPKAFQVLAERAFGRMPHIMDIKGELTIAVEVKNRLNAMRRREGPPIEPEEPRTEAGHK